MVLLLGWLGYHLMRPRFHDAKEIFLGRAWSWFRCCSLAVAEVVIWTGYVDHHHQLIASTQYLSARLVVVVKVYLEDHHPGLCRCSKEVNVSVEYSDNCTCTRPICENQVYALLTSSRDPFSFQGRTEKNVA